MSDRIKGFTVVLDADYRDDAASEIMLVLQNIRGVAKVLPHKSGPQDYIDRERIKRELFDKILKVLE